MSSNIRKLVAGVVVVIVLAFIFMRGDQLVQLAEAIQTGSPLFIILAVLAQLGKYFAQGFGFRACFDTVGEKITFKTGLSLVFGTFFVNTIAPSLNLAGTSLVVDTAHKQGISAGKATSAALLMQLCIDSGFTCIMILTFTVLSLTVGLDPGWLALGMLAIVLVGGLVTVMVLGGVRPDLVVRVLRPVERLVNRILVKFKRESMGPWLERTVESFSGASTLIVKRPKKTVNRILVKFKRESMGPWLERTVESFSGASTLIVKRPKKTLKAFACSLTASLFEITCFAMAGLAFGVQSPEPLICGYVVATLFAMISFTPQGVGVVEAACVVAFGLFGIDGASALVVVMVYRGIVFWMPFLIGAVVIQLGARKKRKIVKAAGGVAESAVAEGAAAGVADEAGDETR